jgi:voltage-gated potassium channel Kch
VVGDARVRGLKTREDFRRRLREGDSYGLLLGAIVVSYVLMAVLREGQWSHVVLGGTFGVVLLLALHTSHVRGTPMRIAVVIVVLWLLFNIVQAIAGEVIEGAGWAMSALVIVSPCVVLNRILRHPKINLETVLGAICAYLLIAIAFGVVYGLVDKFGSEHFFAQGNVKDPVKYLYFSYIVLTTVGFGDLTPATDSGRILVSIEALLGQIFLVTLVASLVANMGRSRNPEQARDTPDDRAAGSSGPDQPPG